MERRLEIGTLRRQLLEPGLLRLVLLLRQRVHPAEGLAAGLEPRHASSELVAIDRLGVVLPAGLGVGSGGDGVVQPAARLRRLALQPRELDLDRR